MFGVVLLGIIIYLFLCLISYAPADPCLGFLQFGYPVNNTATNFGGRFGANISALLFFLFGYISYICLLAMFCYAWTKIWKKYQFSGLDLTGCIFFIIFLASLIESIERFRPAQLRLNIFSDGGIIGYLISHAVGWYFGIKGAVFLLAITTVALFILSSKIFYMPFEDVFQIISPLFKHRASFAPKPTVKKSIKKQQEESSFFVSRRQIKNADQDIHTASRTTVPEPIEEPVFSTIKIQPKSQSYSPKQKKYNGKTYQIPSVSLLKTANRPEKETEKDLRVYAQVIEETLNDFGIEGEVVNFTQGPRVTLYEVQPAPGIPLVKITKLTDNIAMSLKASPIRMVAPIPGKSTIGIEVPNRAICIVSLREILESKVFQVSPSKLTMAIGKNILGKAVISDLKIMPHLLIAGATGSGKTVCLNSLITGILFKATPDEVKFLMIDPKMVELVIYNDIPHLIVPVITDIKKAVNALKWLIKEMDHRYHLFAEARVRNIEAYNIESEEKLPYIVVVVDELADLMLVARNEIENSIIRLTALSRAAGIHLILATQRPSVNVITGIIKANLPCRIAFQVSSKFDSQTILDSKGAEKLLGRGDLLFIPPGRSHPIRAQGGFISDDELESLTRFIKQQAQPEYKMEILTQPADHSQASLNNASFSSSEEDELYSRAVRIVFETRIASISMLQRRLEIGFNRAARLIERMETEGIVGPYREGKPRIILKGPGGEKSNEQANP